MNIIPWKHINVLRLKKKKWGGGKLVNKMGRGEGRKRVWGKERGKVEKEKGLCSSMLIP